MLRMIFPAMILVLPLYYGLGGCLVLNMTKFKVAHEFSLLNTAFQMDGGSAHPTCAEAAAISKSARYFPYDNINPENATFLLGNQFVCQFYQAGGRAFSQDCVMKESEVCNDWSTCLTDECGCDYTSVFYCADGNGCIAINQVSY